MSSILSTAIHLSLSLGSISLWISTSKIFSPCWILTEMMVSLLCLSLWISVSKFEISPWVISLLLLASPPPPILVAERSTTFSVSGLVIPNFEKISSLVNTSSFPWGSLLTKVFSNGFSLPRFRLLVLWFPKSLALKVNSLLLLFLSALDDTFGVLLMAFPLTSKETPIVKLKG